MVVISQVTTWISWACMYSTANPLQPLCQFARTLLVNKSLSCVRIIALLICEKHFPSYEFGYSAMLVGKSANYYYFLQPETLGKKIRRKSIFLNIKKNELVLSCIATYFTVRINEVRHGTRVFSSRKEQKKITFQQKWDDTSKCEKIPIHTNKNGRKKKVTR